MISARFFPLPKPLHISIAPGENSFWKKPSAAFPKKQGIRPAVGKDCFRSVKLPRYESGKQLGVKEMKR
ncbi:MAG TPA: hypothetical protein DD433_10725 [Ruminococcaceae bacterium]|nr:hypothetical protein [Oscillospiraceae bacterium]